MILVFEDIKSTLAKELLEDERNLALFKLNEFLREFRKDKEWVLRYIQSQIRFNFHW